MSQHLCSSEFPDWFLYPSTFKFHLSIQFPPLSLFLSAIKRIYNIHIQFSSSFFSHFLSQQEENFSFSSGQISLNTFWFFVVAYYLSPKFLYCKHLQYSCSLPTDKLFKFQYILLYQKRGPPPANIPSLILFIFLTVTLVTMTSGFLIS